MRVGTVTASARRLPVATWGTAAGVSTNANAVCPLSRLVIEFVAAAVGDRRGRRAGLDLEVLDRQREHRRRRGIVRLVRVGLEPRHQLGDAFGGMGIVHQDEHRIVGHHRDRHEVVEDVVGDLLPDGRADGHGAGRGAEQRVAVGRGFRDGLRREPPGGAGLVLDQDGAADRFLQLLGNDARDRVGAAAGAESDDDPDRAVGVIDLLRPRLRAATPQPPRPSK